MKNGPSMSYVPVVVFRLQRNQFAVRQGLEIFSGKRFGSFGHDSINTTAVWKVDCISANVCIMPVKNVNSAFGTDLHAEPNPCHVISWHKVATMLADETGSIWNHVVGQNRMFMNVAHEQLISFVIGSWKGIS